MNVHHTNISVNRDCSRSGIGWLVSRAHNVPMAKTYRKTFLRHWRKHSGKTLEQVADHLHMTHGQLSKIERGQQPYNQALLEALADLYMCEPADLLIRDPLDPQGIRSVWEHAKPGDKQKIVAVAKTIIGEEPNGKAA